MRRKLRLCLFAAAVGLAAHAATPLIALWQIREAARTGDLATLGKRVEWLSVRRSLKTSLAETRQAIQEVAQDASPPKRGLWQKIRLATLPLITEPLIDRYCTPEGMIEFFALRAKWREQHARAGAKSKQSGPLAETALGGTSIDRALAFGRRIKRYAFVSPGRVEIEVVDRDEAGRRWRVALELRDYAWQLTEVTALGRVQAHPKANDL